jgi:putative spermidine/putrescine transport system permease protein
MKGLTWADRLGTIVMIALACATLAMLAAPAFIVLAISVDTRAYVSFPPSGLTLHWYRDILNQRQIVDGFVTSLEVAAATTLGCIALGLPAALAAVRGKFPGRRALATLIMAPQTMPGIVVGIAILFAGASVRLPASTPMLVVALVTVLLAVQTRIVIARLLRTNPDLERASSNLGASNWQGFIRITLPQLLAAIAGGAAFTFIEAFDNVSVSMFTHSYRARPLPIELLSLVETDNSPLVAAISGVEIALACVVVAVIAATVGLSALAGNRERRVKRE